MLPLIYFLAVGGILFLALRLGCGPCVMGRGTPAALPIVTLGWALSLFLAVTYFVCVAFDLLFPTYAMYATWAGLLPGFIWLTPTGFVVGLVESVLYGWYAALLFGGLYNALAARGRPA